MPTTRIKKSFTRIPIAVADAVKFLAGIGALQARINAAKKKAKEEHDAIKVRLDAELAPLTSERNTLFNALFAFAQPLKEALTREAKSIKLPSGVFGWRWTPPAVQLTGFASDGVLIAHLERRGLHAYVRVVKEVDREALLRDKPAIRGVEYISREEFFAKPMLEKGAGRAEELTEAIDV